MVNTLGGVKRQWCLTPPLLKRSNPPFVQTLKRKTSLPCPYHTTINRFWRTVTLVTLVEVVGKGVG